MSEHSHESTHHHKNHRKEYFIVFFVLTFLTGIELIIPSLQNVAYHFKASSLVLLALGKALVVAYFYMHLKDEKRWLKYIAAIPISAGFYALVLILESMNR